MLRRISQLAIVKEISQCLRQTNLNLCGNASSTLVFNFDNVAKGYNITKINKTNMINKYCIPEIFSQPKTHRSSFLIACRPTTKELELTLHAGQALSYLFKV